MRFRFIEDRRADYPVTILCDVLGVSPAGYYAWRSRPESQRSVANRDLDNGYSGYDGDPGYVVSSGADPSYCAQRYRSYDPASGTYLGYDGLRHPCL